MKMLSQTQSWRSSLLHTESICLRCLLRLSEAAAPQSRRQFSLSPKRKEPITTKSITRGLFRREYFSANGVFDISKSQLRQAASVYNASAEEGKGTEATDSEELPGSLESDAFNNTDRIMGAPLISELPHRRRRRLKDERNAAPDSENIMPPDASSRLATLSSSLPPASLRRLFAAYLSLSKPRLSFLIVLTTASAYSIYPVPALLLPTTTVSPSLSALTLVFLTAGTTFCTASANALNMLLEPQYDAKMSRTRNRPIVRGIVGKKGALIFASIAGVIGTGSLWFGVNPTAAFLGGLNIFLYAGVYTPMKRLSVVNTWVGAVVGAIPPLMGWVAAAGQSATGSGEWRELLFGDDSVGGWLLAGLLFAWQFPHFNALSWNIREEYKNAGYRMLAWVNPRMNGRVAFRYALLLFPICGALSWYGVTDQGFLITSSVVNTWIVREAWKFWRLEGYMGSARGLFWASVWHLPVIMVLAMAHKKGLWESIWQRVIGEEFNDDGWLEEEEETIRLSAKRGHLQQSAAPVALAVF